MWRNESKVVLHLEQINKTINKTLRWSLRVTSHNIKCKQVCDSVPGRVESADHTTKEIEENPVKHISR